MANGKNVKRQRQKEMRRAKVEQEIKQRQAARRNQRLLLLVILALGAAGVAFAMSQNGSRDSEKQKTATEGECSHAKPPAGNTETPNTPPAMTIDKAQTYTAIFETSCGTLEAELAAETSPNTVNSFVFLAKQGFYDGLTFHRIVKDFAIQGGDPKGDGTGGPNYKTVDPPPSEFKYEKGAIAMAKGGPEPPGTAGSQFFFVPAEGAALEPVYAVLGKVVKGENVLEKLNNVPTENKSGEKSSPVEPVYIEKVTIRESAAS